MKKLTVMAVLMAALSFAHAEVSLFGSMDAGINHTQNVGTSDTTDGVKSGGMNTSFWGIKGGEDLGNGTKAVFELSSFVDLGTGAYKGGTTANQFARSSFVGVQNADLGQLTLGRDVNPSFLPTILFNAFGGSSVYSPLWHQTYFGGAHSPVTSLYNDTAWDNQVHYTSPTLGGATTSLHYSKGATGGVNSGGNVMWNSGPLSLAAYVMRTEIQSTGSFQTDVFTNNANKPADAYFVGAAYDAGVAKVFATYQEAKNKSQGMDGKTYQVSTAIPAGKGKVLAEYAHTRYNATTTYSETVVGYNYPLSKRTDLYANYGVMSQSDKDATGRLYGVGMRVNF